MIELEKKLVSISMVKNEEDIIESFVRYNISILDEMIILDNNSNDNTIKILESLKSEGLPVFIYEDTKPEFEQIKHRNWLLLKAVNEFKADIVVPLDADEFIISSNRGNPREIIENIGSNTFYFVKWKTYIPDFKENHEQKFIPKKIILTRDDNSEEFYKVIVPKELVTDYNVRLSKGSHNLIFDQSYQNSIKSVICPKLRIAHFPLRSKEQTISKIAVGWINSYQFDKRKGESFHWQKIFNKLKENADITNQDVKDYAKEYALKDEVTQINLIEDPMDLSFCNFTDVLYSQSEVKPISNLLTTFERISKSNLDFKKESFDNISGLKAEKKYLEGKIASYENSLSWKITSPIRKIGNIYKK